MNMTLHSGHRVDLNNIVEDDIRIDDIAHSLAHICRFGGHTKVFYSVAQHSVRVARALPPELMLEGLLHDATEAIVGDMIRPLKRMLPQYQFIEDKVWRAICSRYRFEEHQTLAVKIADNAALKAELEQFMHGDIELSDGFWEKIKPLPLADKAWSPQEAKGIFLLTYTEALARRAEYNHLRLVPK